MSTEGICWIENEIIPLEDAKVSVMDHGLLYGDGIFEGIRFYNNKAFLLSAHLNDSNHLQKHWRLNYQKVLVN